ncbi:MAG: hypothetical protein FWC22_05525 [Treponema sp.]|nr:hypothetical protein [Treponema sp.]
MKDGIGIFLWKLSVALYLIANGVLGLSKWSGGDFMTIFNRLGFKGDLLNILVLAASVVALVAGIAILLEMFNIKLSFLDTLIFIIAIIWAAYVIVNIITWVTGGFDNFWYELQRLAVHIMVLASLLIASKRLG